MGTPIPVPVLGSRLGFNSSISTTSFVTVSNAVVVEPGGVQAKVSSTSANDTAVGSGIQKVRLRYFDANWVLNDEIVTLNGITAVNTVATDITRVEAFEAFQIGTSLGGAAGTIKLQNLAATQLFAQIDIGGNQFLRAQHTVSPGKSANITDIIISASLTGGVSFVLFREQDNTPDGGNIVLISDLAFTLVSEVMQISLRSPVICDASASTQGLRMGISALGLAPAQAALVSFHFNEL